MNSLVLFYFSLPSFFCLETERRRDWKIVLNEDKVNFFEENFSYGVKKFSRQFERRSRLIILLRRTLFNGISSSPTIKQGLP